LAVLDVRERLVFKLGVFAGMRCSEIFGLRRGRVQGDHVEVLERVSRRDIDTPKTEKSVRKVALSSAVKDDLKVWLESTPGVPDAWLFPSENPKMPIGADNMMARYIKPKLRAPEVGLGWVDYRVMRRTHSSLMSAQGLRAMQGPRSLRTARRVIQGIEALQMIRKGQLLGSQRSNPATTWLAFALLLKIA
jgi:integrase